MKKIVLLCIVSAGMYSSCMKKEKPENIVPVYLCSVGTFLLDNTFDRPQVITADTLNAKVFGLQLTLSYSPLPSCTGAVSAEGNESYRFDQEINAITIITNVDFDSMHPAGSDVSEYFFIFDRTNYYNYTFVDLEDYLNKSAHIDWSLEQKMDVLLMKTPEHPDNFQFEIRLFLNDGTIVETTTEQIYLEL